MCQPKESVLNEKYSYIQEFFRLYNTLIKFLAYVMLTSSPEEGPFIVSFSKRAEVGSVVRLCSLLILYPFFLCLCLLFAEAGNGGRKAKKILAQIRKAHISCKFRGPWFVWYRYIFLQTVLPLAFRELFVSNALSPKWRTCCFFFFFFKDWPQILPLLP